MKKLLGVSILLIIGFMACSKPKTVTSVDPGNSNTRFVYGNELSRMHVGMIHISFSDSAHSGDVDSSNFVFGGDTLYPVWATAYYETIYSGNLSINVKFIDTISNKIISEGACVFALGPVDSWYHSNSHIVHFYTVHDKNNMFGVVPPGCFAFPIDSTYRDSTSDSLYVFELTPVPTK